jgi:NAD-dependent DNA ligase
MELKHEGHQLARIHLENNQNKANAYWVGFLQGLLASGRFEQTERFPLKVEATHFLTRLADPDANDLLEELNSVYAVSNAEMFELLQTIVENRTALIGDLEPKQQVNLLMGKLAGVACDSRIYVPEAHMIVKTLKEFPHEVIDPRFQRFLKRLKAILADNIIDADEEAEISDWIRKFVGDCANDTGIATAQASPNLGNSLPEDKTINWEAQNCVVTGKFVTIPRTEVISHLERLGSTVQRNVTQGTTIVVVASELSRDWKYSHHGTKIEYALQLIESGSEIFFVYENQFEHLFGLKS